MTQKNQTKILIHDFVVSARVGIHAHEHAAAQRICVSIEVTLSDPEITGDRIESTVSYSDMVMAIRNLGQQHFNLVETLAEHLAAVALQDPRTQCAKVTVEKLDVYPEGRVGTEIIRYR